MAAGDEKTTEVEQLRRRVAELEERDRRTRGAVFAILFDRAVLEGRADPEDVGALHELWISDPGAAADVLRHSWAATA